MSKILGDCLPEEIIDLLNQKITTVVVSTITPDGYPHALPIGLTIAPDPKTIYMAFMKGHQSVENIKHNSNAFITVMDSPDLAVGIRATAHVVKEPMEGNPAMAIIEFKVEQVKSDTSPTAKVLSGVRIEPRTELGDAFMRTMIDELREYSVMANNAKSSLI